MEKVIKKAVSLLHQNNNKPIKNKDMKPYTFEERIKTIAESFITLNGIRLPLNDLVKSFIEMLESRGAEGRAIAAAINIDELASLLDEFAVEEEEF